VLRSFDVRLKILAFLLVVVVVVVLIGLQLHLVVAQIRLCHLHHCHICFEDLQVLVAMKLGIQPCWSTIIRVAVVGAK
jgi:hypothetical protein